MIQGIFRCLEIQLAIEESNAEQRDFFLDILFACTSEFFLAFSKAEIKEAEASFARVESLDSTAERNFFSKVLSLLITIRFCR